LSGEITLKGKVLPVGGIKEKLLAAHRHGILEVVLPLDNKPDLKDLPKKVRDDMKIHFVENMDQVLEIALTEKYLEKIQKEKAPITSELAENEEGEGQQEPPVTH